MNNLTKKCNLKDHKSDDDKKIKDYKKRESHQTKKKKADKKKPVNKKKKADSILQVKVKGYWQFPINNDPLDL